MDTPPLHEENIPHSTACRGGVGHRASKPSRDTEVESVAGFVGLRVLGRPPWGRVFPRRGSGRGYSGTGKNPLFPPHLRPTGMKRTREVPWWFISPPPRRRLTPVMLWHWHHACGDGTLSSLDTLRPGARGCGMQGACHIPLDTHEDHA